MVMVASFILLCVKLGNAEFYAGFLFLLCWSALEEGKLEKLPRAVFGSAFGLALGYSLHFFTTGSLGATGGYIFGAFVLPVIYCQLMGWFPLLVNFTAMTFLTVITIPHIQQHGDFGKTAIALLLGIVYFGAILGVASRLSGTKQQDQTG